MSRRRIVLLGATGSIGESTLRVVAAHSDKLELVGIAAHTNAEKLAAIARDFSVRHVALYDAAAAARARETNLFSKETTLHEGHAGLCAIAALAEADIVLVAVVGTTALEPTLAAIAAGKDIALASKEILVLAGQFVMAAARKNGVRILPVDSEHNALFQCIEDHSSAPERIRKIYLTASGGAFRDRELCTLANATPEEALRHPNWSMGQKVTIDSATLANKGLEMIEAQWLFNLSPEQIEPVIHPQSIVHGMVEFIDGSVLAQLCPPSMTFAIQHALLHPERARGVDATLDFRKLMQLEFRPVDETRYPCLAHARHAMRTGGTAPAVFNAANEIAVAAFLAHKIGFLEIASVIGKTLAAIPHQEPTALETVLAADQQARTFASSLISQRSTL